MSTYNQEVYTFRSWLKDQIFLGMTVKDYLKSLITPFNIIVFGFLIFIGIPVSIRRFMLGLGATTNLSNNNPWGIWIGFDVMSGVALAAGGFVMATAVHVFGVKKYAPLVRPAILTGFLGYFFVVIGLLFDIGRPWRLPFPMFVSFGTASILFLIAWHVALYLSTQFVEFCPTLFEWLGWSKLRQWSARITVGASIFGAILSTLHQSALGGLLLLVPSKIHPLWYSEYIPVFFFVSALAAGCAMVIVESCLSRRFLKESTDAKHSTGIDELTLGLGKALSVILFTYFGLKIIGIAHGNHWNLLNTSMGYWFLAEILGFILFPCFLAAWSVREGRSSYTRIAAFITVVGIVINRLNVSLVAFNWNIRDRYFPGWMEVVITITIILIGIITFRWIVKRMPVLREKSDYQRVHR